MNAGAKRLDRWIERDQENWLGLDDPEPDDDSWTAEELAAYDRYMCPEVDATCRLCGMDLDAHHEVTREDTYGADYLTWDCPDDDEIAAYLVLRFMAGWR